MQINQSILQQYAEAVVRIGVNLQRNDGVIVSSGTEALPLLREVVKACWRAGAKDVVTRISDDEITLAKFENAADEAFDFISEANIAYHEALLKDDYARIALSAVNPELMKNVDKGRLKKEQEAGVKLRERLNPYMDTGRIKWTVVACPTRAWAKSVFPDLNEEEGVAKLWENVLAAARITGGDAVSNWQRHDAALKQHQQWLNAQQFEKLHYEAPGTDLVVTLAEDCVWMGGSSRTPSGISYMPNMPTEEIFTAPHARKVDGTLAATRPLCLMGNIIEGIRFVFKDGKAVEYHADKNGEVLENMLNMDEGARRLGEVAIVPNHSPINQTGLLFMNTLFDENASCHFAVGNAYADTIRGGETMSDGDRAKRGANKSGIHIDFMVGSDRLNITGIKRDGTKVPVLINGEWAD